MDRAATIRDLCADTSWVLSSYVQPPLPSKRQRKLSLRLRDYAVNRVRILTDVVEPSTYKQTRSSPQWAQWEEAMDEEIMSLRCQGTWKLVSRLDMQGRKAITCRWVYAIKRNEQSEIKRNKARLAIHGFKQLAGVEYTEPYALSSNLRRSELPSI